MRGSTVSIQSVLYERFHCVLYEKLQESSIQRLRASFLRGFPVNTETESVRSNGSHDSLMNTGIGVKGCHTHQVGSSIGTPT